MPRTPLRDLKPELFENEYLTQSDETDSEGKYSTLKLYCQHNGCKIHS